MLRETLRKWKVEEKKLLLDELRHWDDLEIQWGWKGEERCRDMAKQDFKKVVALEELKWKQKAKVHWLKADDNNTKYFHKIASAGGNVDYISKLTIGEDWVEVKDRLKNHVVSYFKDLYNDNGQPRPNLEGLEFKRISEEERVWLERPISEEVKKKIWRFTFGTSSGWDKALLSHIWYLNGYPPFC